MDKLIVVKDNAFLALEKGDSFYFDKESDMFVYSNVEEEIGDNSFKTSTNKVMISKDLMVDLIDKEVVQYEDTTVEDEPALPPMWGECENCKNANEAIDGIDWEAYDLGLQLKEMLTENDYGRKS